jgi:hypothetical protein
LPSLLRLGTFATVGVAATIGYATIAESLAFLGLSGVGFGCRLRDLRPVVLSRSQAFHFRIGGAHSIAAPRFVIAATAGLLIAAGAPLLFAEFLVPRSILRFWRPALSRRSSASSRRRTSCSALSIRRRVRACEPRPALAR